MKRAVMSVFILMGLAFVISCQTQEQKAAQYDKYFNQGWEMTNKEDFAAAIPLYQKAIRTMPNDPKVAVAYNNLGWSLQKTGDLNGARAAYEKALQLAPDNQLAQNNLAEVKRQLAASPISP